MTPRGRSRAVRSGPAPVLVAVLAALLLVSGCGDSSGPSGPAATDTGPVRVGAGPGIGQRLVAEIYARGLELRGVEVVRDFGPQVPPTTYADVRDGRVDLAPAATGGLLALLDPASTATAPGDVEAGVRSRLPPGLTLLTPSVAEDTDAVVVTRATASAGLRTLADLAPRCPTLTVGGPAPFAARRDGLPALNRTYGCAVAGYRALPDVPSAVRALGDGSVGAAVLPSADPAIQLDDLVVLADVDHAFTAQQIAPLTTRSAAADPRVVEVLDHISSQLDTQVLTDLDRRVTGPTPSQPALVARDWLSAAGVG